MSNSDRYRMWLKRVREIAHEPVILSEWISKDEDTICTTYSFTVPKEQMEPVMRLFQQSAQIMRPCDESYYMTMDQVRYIRRCINEGRECATTIWSD